MRTLIRHTFQFAHRILVLLVHFDTNAMIKRQVNVTTTHLLSAAQRMLEFCCDCGYWSVAKFFFRSSFGECECIFSVALQWNEAIIGQMIQITFLCGINFYHSHSMNVFVCVRELEVRKSFQTQRKQNGKEEEDGKRYRTLFIISMALNLHYSFDIFFWLSLQIHIANRNV